MTLETMVGQYADKPPAGYAIRPFRGGKARDGDLAYRGFCGGRWVTIRPGMNIIGADAWTLWYEAGVMAIAGPVR